MPDRTRAPTGFRWAFRRAATWFSGEGPRRIVSLGAGGPRWQLQLQEHAPAFTAPVYAFVGPHLPDAVADWPTSQRVAAPRQVWRARNAGLYDDDGAVYDVASRRAFAETLDSWDGSPQHHPALTLRRGLAARQFDGLSIFLGGLGGQTFYHFLVEILPKLDLLRPWLGGARRLIVQNYLESNKLAWLRFLGVDLAVEWLPPLGHFLCDELMFCPSLVRDSRPDPDLVARLARLARVLPPKNRTRRVWASRQQSHMRPTPWESELIKALPAGWEPVDFGRLTPKETVELGRECACFAGLHGAAFANLAVWPAGIRVLEIYTRRHLPWYPALSLSAGHHHQVLFAETAADIPRVLARLPRQHDAASRANECPKP